jgi:mRNA export factor
MDKLVTGDFQDTITAIAWSPSNTYIAVGSWDGTVAVMECGGDKGIDFKFHMHTMSPSPVLSVDWLPDETHVVLGCVDGMGRMWSIMDGQVQDIARHADSISKVIYSDFLGLLITAGWDGYIRYWDMKTPTPVGEVALDGKIYSMDAKGHVMVAGGLSGSAVFDLNNPTAYTVFKNENMETYARSTAVMADGSGFVTGSCDGRVRVAYLSKAREKDNFTFRCHRADRGRTKEVYSISSIAVDKKNRDRFCTAGTDGMFTFWNIVGRKKMFDSKIFDEGISVTALSSDGTVLVYAVGYDCSSDKPRAVGHKLFARSIR